VKVDGPDESSRNEGPARRDEEQLRANLFRMRDGKVVRLIFYSDRGRAFADLGLSPDRVGA
jgi:hypothetical protein